MKQEIFKVNNFIFHKLPSNECVVQNKKGLVKITHENLIALIQYMEKSRLTNIEYNDIEQFLKEEINEGINFLNHFGIIETKKDYNNFKINQIYFLTNDNKVGKELNEKIYQASLEYEVKFDKVEILEELKGKKLNDNDLLVVFMNKYDKNFMKKLYKLIKKYNCLTLISYSYNNNVYIDNLYKYSWKNPCHFCNIGNIEAKLRVNSSGEMSYQSMIDMLYEEDSSFSVESIFGSIESVNIICSILNRLDNLIFRSQGYTYLNHEKLNEVNNSILIDLSTKKISEDISIHWELCDCYE